MSIDKCILDVLSLIPYAMEDHRFIEMLEIINGKQLENSSFKPESVWRAYKNWSFGKKRESSP
jgi:hypothetical protein